MFSLYLSSILITAIFFVLILANNNNTGYHNPFTVTL